MKKIKPNFSMWVIIWVVYIVLAILFFLIPRIEFKEADQTKENLSHIVLANPVIEATEKAALYFNSTMVATLSYEEEPQYFYPLSDYERWLVESIVAGESGIEPYWGKVAVASCILNACLLEDKRPEEIQTMYSYAGWEPIEEFESECMEAYGNTDLADEVREAVSQVFDKGEVLSNEILWFCSGYSEWHESQRFVIEISNHKFFAPWN